MAGGSSYMTVPNPAPPGGEADLGADRPTSYMSDGSVMPNESGLLGAMAGPAPSIMSRDSTFSSLAGPPSIAPSGPRSSWGSAMAFGGDGPVGANEYGRPRVASNLAYSSPFPDDEEEQGHIQPNAAVPNTDKEVPVWAGGAVPKKRKSRALFWAIILALVLLCLGIALGVGLGITKPWENKSGSSKDSSNQDDNKSTTESGATDSTDDNKPTSTTSASSAAPSPSASVAPTWGGQGSIITLEDGTNMTYDNPFGGFWVFDPQNPLNNSARCNSWSPPLSEEWKWGEDIIHGVNLGGWLNTEPFIVPGLYEATPSGTAGRTVDEYTLSRNLGSNLEKAMRAHYDTFITERDFAEIASAGINWIRLPIAHWAIKTMPGEPYLEKVSWEYVLKAFQWARKYGIRINLDLHTVPGSQNGWNHSGHLGAANWLNGAMGLANAQASLDIIRTIAQFISQDEWAPVVGMFGFLNEPNSVHVDRNAIGGFYIEVYNMVRAITGKGKGPMLSMHDSFSGLTVWNDFARGADRLAIDQHPYICFPDQPGGLAGTDVGAFKYLGCQRWSQTTNQTSIVFGPNTAGEFSAAVNDCGEFVNGVGLGTRFDGTYDGWTGQGIGSCADWNDHRTWDAQKKSDLLEFVTGSMDALQNWFFWTWKIGNSTTDIPQPNPMWHYRLGLQNGWIPKDPRSVMGFCNRAAGVEPTPFVSFTAGGMTGGADGIVPLPTGDFPFPPASFKGGVPAASMASIYQYTPTANPVTLPGPTYTPPGAQKAFDFGSGWANANAASRRDYAPIAGCQYGDEYTAASDPVPATACGAGLSMQTARSLNERAPEPVITPAPKRK